MSLRVEAAPGGGAPAFVNASRPDAVPLSVVPAVERGVRGAAQGSAGFAWPAIDIRVTLLSGRAHEIVPPSEIAFEAAASQAFERAFEAAGPVLLEPAMRLEVHVPMAFTGDVLADLNRRRVVIESSEAAGDVQILTGRVPLSTMFGYSTSVRSLTQGRAGYSMEPCGYEAVPPEIAGAMSL